MFLVTTLFYFFSSINSMTFDFERTIVIDDSVETVHGTVYFSPENKTIMEIQHPILQYMIFEKSHWTVYYPQEKYAYDFKSQKPFQIPFVEILLSSLREDFGLLKAGYQVDFSKVSNDTIFSYWGVEDSDLDYKIKLSQFKDKLISFELFDKDIPRIKTIFSKHYQYQSKYFPTHIFSEIFQSLGNKNHKIIERIEIINFRFNIPFPERIQQFEIPSDVKITELEQ